MDNFVSVFLNQKTIAFFLKTEVFRKKLIFLFSNRKIMENSEKFRQNSKFS